MPQVSIGLIELVSWPTHLTGWNWPVHSFNQTRPMTVCTTQMPKRKVLAMQGGGIFYPWTHCIAYGCGGADIRRFRAAVVLQYVRIYMQIYIIYIIESIYRFFQYEAYCTLYYIRYIIVCDCSEDRINRSAQSGNRNHRVRTAPCDIMDPTLLANLRQALWLAGGLQIRK